jgi:hypothetical protein
MAQQSSPASRGSNWLDTAHRAVKAKEEERQKAISDIRKELDAVDNEDRKFADVSDDFRAEQAQKRQELQQQLRDLDVNVGNPTTAPKSDTAQSDSATSPAPADKLTDDDVEKLKALLEDEENSLEDALYILDLSEADVRQKFGIPDTEPLDAGLVVFHMVHDHQQAIDELDTRVSNIEPRLEKVEKAVGIKPHVPTDHGTHTPPRWNPRRDEEHEAVDHEQDNPSRPPLWRRALNSFTGGNLSSGNPPKHL